jgi:hypothetical protein
MGQPMDFAATFVREAVSWALADAKRTPGRTSSNHLNFDLENRLIGNNWATTLSLGFFCRQVMFLYPSSVEIRKSETRTWSSPAT